jgi:transcriptional regulator with XRE-family HTH domain
MTGKCLRHLRTRAGIRGEDVATAIDRAYNHLTRVEREDKEICLPLSSWFNLSELLNIPIDKLPR